MNSKKWSIIVLLLALTTLFLLGGLTAVVDPFFHYHKPLPSLQYPLDDNYQRYLNDGIIKHFDYDAIITGTSMTENFKVSEFDALFGANAIKVPFSGATFTELNNNLNHALEVNPKLDLVLFALDSWFLLETPGTMRTDAEFPYHLYDDSPLNDIPYLLNKEILCRNTLYTFEYTAQGNATTSFDDYSFWGNTPFGVCGKDIAIGNSVRAAKSDQEYPLSDGMRQAIADNLNQSVIQMARAHPNIRFLYFYPPYSILKWDEFQRTGYLQCQIDTWKEAASLLTAEDNIQLFAFFTDFETITNLDNYRDDTHYSSDISALLLQRMAEGEGLLTPDHLDSYFQEVADFYSTYNYDSIYE